MDVSSWAIWDTCVGFPGFTRIACASWVQAIGSVLAIVAAALLMFGQHQLEVRRAEAEAVRRWRNGLEAAYHLVKAVRRLLEEGEAQTKGALDWSQAATLKARKDALADLIDRVDVLNLDSPVAVDALIAAQGLCRLMASEQLAMFQSWAEHGNLPMASRSYVVSYPKWQALLDGHLDTLRKAIEQGP